MKRFTMDMAYKADRAGKTIDPQELALQEKRKRDALVKTMNGFKTGFFDIETTNLNGDIGHILCGVIFEDGIRRAHVFRRDDPRIGDPHGQDKKLSSAIVGALSEYDMIVTFFGHPFDWKMLESRLIHHGYKQTANPFHCDLYYEGKRHYNLHNGRLETLAQHLNVPIRKTHLNWDTWNLADHGDEKAMDYIVDHCVKDTKMLRQCFHILKYRIQGIWRR